MKTLVKGKGAAISRDVRPPNAQQPTERASQRKSERAKEPRQSARAKTSPKNASIRRGWYKALENAEKITENLPELGTPGLASVCPLYSRNFSQISTPSPLPPHLLLARFTAPPPFSTPSAHCPAISGLDNERAEKSPPRKQESPLRLKYQARKNSEPTLNSESVVEVYYEPLAMSGFLYT